MAGEQVDLVAGDFNGACWRDASVESSIEELFVGTPLPLPPDRSPPRGLGAVRPWCFRWTAVDFYNHLGKPFVENSKAWRLLHGQAGLKILLERRTHGKPAVASQPLSKT